MDNETKVLLDVIKELIDAVGSVDWSKLADQDIVPGELAHRIMEGNMKLRGTVEAYKDGLL